MPRQSGQLETGGCKNSFKDNLVWITNEIKTWMTWQCRQITLVLHVLFRHFNVCGNFWAIFYCMAKMRRQMVWDMRKRPFVVTSNHPPWTGRRGEWGWGWTTSLSQLRCSLENSPPDDFTTLHTSSLLSLTTQKMAGQCGTNSLSAHLQSPLWWLNDMGL